MIHERPDLPVTVYRFLVTVEPRWSPEVGEREGKAKRHLSLSLC